MSNKSKLEYKELKKTFRLKDYEEEAEEEIEIPSYIIKNIKKS